jgi:hypothetical protein
MTSVSARQPAPWEAKIAGPEKERISARTALITTAGVTVAMGALGALLGGRQGIFGPAASGLVVTGMITGMMHLSKKPTTIDNPAFSSAALIARDQERFTGVQPLESWNMTNANGVQSRDQFVKDVVGVYKNADEASKGVSSLRAKDPGTHYEIVSVLPDSKGGIPGVYSTESYPNPDFAPGTDDVYPLLAVSMQDSANQANVNNTRGLAWVSPAELGSSGSADG